MHSSSKEHTNCVVAAGMFVTITHEHRYSYHKDKIKSSEIKKVTPPLDSQTIVIETSATVQLNK